MNRKLFRKDYDHLFIYESRFLKKNVKHYLLLSFNCEDLLLFWV